MKQKKLVEDKSIMYQHIIENTDWENYKAIPTPSDEESTFKNYYHVYQYKKVSSFCDPETKKNGKTIVELDLDENLSHTSNVC